MRSPGSACALPGMTTGRGYGKTGCVIPTAVEGSVLRRGRSLGSARDDNGAPPGKAETDDTLEQGEYFMKALILNSGLGTRMGDLTREHPKCMTEIAPGETIVSRQLRLLAEAGVRSAVMTTGVFADVLREHCGGLGLPLEIAYVPNPRCRETNYIYSIYCARELLEDDILLMHGDLVFDREVLAEALASPVSCMAVSSAVPLPEKDFKAVVRDGIIRKVGIGFFDEAVAAQPLYALRKDGWMMWLGKIAEYCEAGNTKVYAENALNELDGAAGIRALDVGTRLCAEVDNPEDLQAVRAALKGGQ